MIYQTFLNRLRKRGDCPFCNFPEKFVIAKNGAAILSVARAPYTRDHLIVIPRRHVLFLKQLRERERARIMDLIAFGIDILRKKYGGVEISYKEGDDLASSGKSIYHLHFHLVPKKRAAQRIDRRKFLSDKQLIREVEKFRKLGNEKK